MQHSHELCDVGGGEQPVALKRLGKRLSALRLAQPAATERMRRSLDRQGQLTAVVAFDDGGKLELVDGFKRHRAAAQLGWSGLRVRVLPMQPAEAIAAIGTLHQRCGLTELEQGWMIRTLHRKHGLSQGAIGRLMSRHKSWISRRLMLVESLDEAVQADVRLGLLSPRAAVAVAALPRGNQRQAAKLVAQRGMTSRQAESMAQRLRELGSDKQREQLMGCWPDGPQRPAAKPPRQRSEAEQLMSNIAAIKRAAVRLEVRLASRPLATLGPAPAGHVLGALSELGAVLRALDGAIARAKLVDEELNDAQLPHA
jgi:ParB-like chromosome segregation protein Spo0J